MRRRSFLMGSLGGACVGLIPAVGCNVLAAPQGEARGTGATRAAPGGSVSLFLAGDVMTGRGIDQILGHPGNPRLYERVAKSASTYVALAEQANGPLPRRVPPQYVWGDALAELDRVRPDARIINLETAVTRCDDHWIGKAVNYRMHPANVDCLVAAKVDCCSIANNHVLDWTYVGLRETLTTLHGAGLRTVGAGSNRQQAQAPAIIELTEGRRVLVFAYGSPSSGVPDQWAANDIVGGVNDIDERDPAAAGRVTAAVRAVKRPGDVAVVSVHWGSNWGYEVTDEQQRLARALIDDGSVDVVYGHSSHHPRPLEVHRGKLILYGCGDFLNDYEGISGHESFRPELGFMYLPQIDVRGGRLRRLNLVPTRVRNFRVTRAGAEEANWLVETMNREGRAFGSRFQLGKDGSLALELA